jgi:hypothetical protein
MGTIDLELTLRVAAARRFDALTDARPVGISDGVAVVLPHRPARARSVRH